MKRSAALAAVLVACAPLPDAPDAGVFECQEWGPPSPVGTLAPEELTEVSGLAASRVHPGVYFTHNDSGGAAELFALHEDGTLAGRWLVDGQQSRDWEAIAAGACPEGGDCLFIGEVGDNEAKHESVKLIVVREPEVLTSTTPLSPVAVLEVRYDEGPRDCEAIFVDDAGAVYLLEKFGEGLPHGVWRIGSDAFDGAAVEAKRFATLTLDRSGDTLVTDADLHPTRNLLVVRTYFSVQLFEGDTLAQALASEALYLPGAEFGFEDQGEAIAWSADGTKFLTTSEGQGATVSQWACER